MILSTLNDPISVIVAVLVAIVAALFAVFFLSLWYQEWRKARATLSWPTATGRVLTSKVTHRRGRTHSSNSTITVYDPQITYEYTVNGTTYQGNQIAVSKGISTPTREDVAHKIALYPVDATVQVFYDPTNPQEAVLEHGVGGAILFFFIGGFIILVLVVLFFPWNQIFK